MSLRTVSASTYPFVLSGALLGTLFAGAPADAAEVTDIASAFDVGNPFDAHVSLTYHRRLSRGAINRERVGDSGQTRINLAKELRYSHDQHVLTPRLEVGVWHDLQLHIELPIVVSDNRSLDFAQAGGGSCGDPPETNCVTPRNSTLVADGFLNGAQMGADQVSVGGSDGAPGGLVLPERKGLDQLNFGITWAAMNQTRVAGYPTWLLGFEARLAVGDPMTYDPQDPLGNTSVGRGIHQLHFWMSVSRRFRYLDPWFSLFYMLPIATSSSLFESTSFQSSGQQRRGPRHIAGFGGGVEIVPWERPARHDKFSIEIGSRLTAVFDGRGYSPAWELLAGNDVLQGPCHPNPAAAPATGPPWDNGTFCARSDDVIPYPGITHIENHLNYTGSLAFNIYLTQYFHGRVGLALGHDQAHYITFEDPGRASSRNGQIDPSDPLQVNPLYRSVIDTVGRRLKVEESTVFDVSVSLAARF